MTAHATKVAIIQLGLKCMHAYNYVQFTSVRNTFAS